MSGKVSSLGGSISIDPPAKLSMSSTASINSGGGSISLQATGNIELASINAGSGAINLTAGGSVSSANGFVGTNLVGGATTLTVGGNAYFSAQVLKLDTSGVMGIFSITDASGKVMVSGIGTTPATVEQLISTTTGNLTSLANNSSSVGTLDNLSLTINALIGNTDSTSTNYSNIMSMLNASGATIGGTPGSFGSSDPTLVGSTLPTITSSKVPSGTSGTSNFGVSGNGLPSSGAMSGSTPIDGATDGTQSASGNENGSGNNSTNGSGNDKPATKPTKPSKC